MLRVDLFGLPLLLLQTLSASSSSFVFTATIVFATAAGKGHNRRKVIQITIQIQIQIKKTMRFVCNYVRFLHSLGTFKKRWHLIYFIVYFIHAIFMFLFAL